MRRWYFQLMVTGYAGAGDLVTVAHFVCEFDEMEPSTVRVYLDYFREALLGFAKSKGAVRLCTQRKTIGTLQGTPCRCYWGDHRGARVTGQSDGGGWRRAAAGMWSISADGGPAGGDAGPAPEPDVGRSCFWW